MGFSLMFDSLKRNLKGSLRRLQRNLFDNSKISYSQCGEDLILSQLFCDLGISKINYVDVGAHHPSYLSNTYLFYSRGDIGVCIEPDPELFQQFLVNRPRDTNLNYGVGIQEGIADFFVMSTSTLNTFSKLEADRYVSGGHKILNTLSIKIENLNSVIERNCKRAPNLISLDIEGWDFIILDNFDFTKCRPEVFCLETLSYTDDNSERKLTEIVELMHMNGYFTYADTYINTIFVDRLSWENRPL